MIVNEFVSGTGWRKSGRTKACGGLVTPAGRGKLTRPDALFAVGMGIPDSMWPASRRRNHASPSAVTVRSYQPLFSKAAKNDAVPMEPGGTVTVRAGTSP